MRLPIIVRAIRNYKQLQAHHLRFFSICIEIVSRKERK